MAPSADLCASALKRMALPLLVREWRKRIREAPIKVPVANLYCGRGFQTAVQAADQFGAAIHVLSAGMGIVNICDAVPSYSLTVTRGSRDFILKKVSESTSATSYDWWSTLTGYNGTTSVSDVLDKNRTALVLLGITSAYLSMIADELASLSERQLHRVRIIGPKYTDGLPEALQSLVMPYDKRLNGPDSDMRGTEFDFAQRALASFIRLTHDDKSIASPAQHAKRVRLSLSQKRAPRKEKRKQVSDAMLRRHIGAIRKHVFSISAGLRTLRKQKKVACEQNRFSRIWVQQEASS